MKFRPVYISLFIFIVIGLLAALAAVFPKEGIQIGDITLRFPSLQEFLCVNEKDTVSDDTPSPEELLALQLAQMRSEEEMPFISFFTYSPERICFPQTDSTATGMGDSTYLDGVYRALLQADTAKVHIVHYGDSQIEEDRITLILRRRLQERFSGNGVGLLPLYQSVQTRTVGQHTIPEPTRYMVYGMPSMRRQNNLYGPMGQVAILDTTIRVSITPRSKMTGLYSAHYADRLTLLTRSESPVYATVQGQHHTINPNSNPLQFTTIQLKDSTTRLNLQLSGKGDIYGILLEGRHGVNIDNIPMRGCSGTVFTGINREQLSTYFQQTNTRLIILQYGGNRVPSLHSEKRIQEYISNITKQIEYLHSLAPEAAILFIGPSDMSTRYHGTMQTYPVLPAFEARLARAVTHAGAAYWSLFNAMGGQGAMLQWVKTGLAGSDHIHFTAKGAEKAGDMLYQSLMKGFDYYLWRQTTYCPVDQNPTKDQ